MTRPFTFSALVLLLAAIGLSYAQEQDVEVTIRAFVVQDDGTLVETADARPGDIVEYHVTATNQTGTTLPAESVEVHAPVPEGTELISGSATDAPNLILEFSEDNETFLSVSRRETSLIRWTLRNPMEPDESFDFEYRVEVNASGSRPETYTATELTEEANTTDEPTPSTPEDDFRGFNWGASAEEVRAGESLPFLQEETGALVFSGTVNGKETVVVYQFLPSGLATAGYLFQDEYTNRNQYIDEYEEVKATLTRLYGPPSSDVVNWSDDLYRDDPSEHGLAVSLGHVIYSSEWTTDTTIIRHVLSGNNYEIEHAVIYNSIELQDDTQQQQEGTEDDAF
jgi:uncharacterized repeat protein (TIGR01451 family)